jgi:hypothetical protein
MTLVPGDCHDLRQAEMLSVVDRSVPASIPETQGFTFATYLKATGVWSSQARARRVMQCLNTWFQAALSHWTISRKSTAHVSIATPFALTSRDHLESFCTRFTGSRLRLCTTRRLGSTVVWLSYYSLGLLAYPFDSTLLASPLPIHLCRNTLCMRLQLVLFLLLPLPGSRFLPSNFDPPKGVESTQSPEIPKARNSKSDF